MSEPCPDDTSKRDQHPPSLLRRETDVAQSSVSPVLVSPPVDGELASLPPAAHRPNLPPPSGRQSLRRPSGFNRKHESRPASTQAPLPFDQPRSAEVSTPAASDAQRTVPSEPAARETAEPVDSYDRRISTPASPTTSADAASPRKVSVQAWHDLRLLLRGIRDAAESSDPRERRQE